MFDEEIHSKIIIENGDIKKLKISQYNPITSTVTLLILCENNNVKELRFYTIQNMLLDKNNGVNIIKSNIDYFIFE